MERTGALKIYFGYAEGVGKTQAMLQEARDAKTRGKDVAAGCIEIRRHEGTQELLQGLEVIGSMKMAGQEPDGGDLDLDQILERRPQIFLVDDLAHVNAEGSRHARRYQDVKELLTAGIEVWTTLNVQELESLNDVVVSIAGRETTERIPDEIFELAQEVVLVDCEPSRLMKRVSDNDICGVGQRRYGGADFYTIEKLTSFREIAMLRCADRLDKRRRQEELDRGKTTIGKDHILVCLSSSPSNARIIRIASRMAEAYHASLTALFVETTDYPAWPEKDKERLRFNIHLAEQLGATVETVHGEDVPYQIIEFARMSGVSKVVVGRSRKGKRTLFRQPLLTEELIQKAPNLGVYIIPDYVQESYHEKRSLQRTNLIVSLRDIGISVLVLLLTTLLGFGFAGWGFSEANIITIYILGVLVISVITSGRAYSIAASAVSVLVFNFFFTDPKLTFRAYDKSYPVTFLVMFLASFITGSLATKMKNHAKQAAQAAFRTQTLFDTNQLLQQAEGKEEIIEAAAGQIKKLLGMDVIVYPAENGELQNPQIFPVAERLKDPACVSKEEAEVAEWVYRNNRHNPLTAATIAKEAGVDGFIAECKPEDKITEIQKEQAEGKIVAMTGDGTNDAPALAQADVGLAMNSGTTAAKEAANMVDLDSDPTKILEVVEIGKQLLITRGSLTTFSIANDVAKYFAIIPAMFTMVIPQMEILNIMHLSTPFSAILSALIFNAVIIPCLIPIAMRGVKYKPMRSEKMLIKNIGIYGLGGIIVPFIGIKLIDLIVTPFLAMIGL